MKITLYAAISKEQLLEKGKDFLDGDELRMFCCFNEVLIEVEVDKSSGIVTGAEIFSHFGKKR